jgi:hypothetical protein
MDGVVICHPSIIDIIDIINKYVIITNDTRYDRYTNTYKRKN